MIYLYIGLYLLATFGICLAHFVNQEDEMRLGELYALLLLSWLVWPVCLYEMLDPIIPDPDKVIWTKKHEK